MTMFFFGFNGKDKKSVHGMDIDANGLAPSYSF